jgi:broad specificity phosphatase PhoE
MRLLLITHAETDWNVSGRYQGHADPPLNAQGRRQAALLAERLAGVTITAAHTSDLCRASETAAAITSARAEPRLRELNFGAWEGLTHAQVAEKYPQDHAAWSTDPLLTAPTGGETLHHLGQRLASFLDELASERNRTELLVAHRGCLRVFLCLVLKMPLTAQWRFRLDPASISVLEMTSGGAMLAGLNDRHHLGEEGHAG